MRKTKRSCSHCSFCGCCFSSCSNSLLHHSLSGRGGCGGGRRRLDGAIIAMSGGDHRARQNAVPRYMSRSAALLARRRQTDGLLAQGL